MSAVAQVADALAGELRGRVAGVEQVVGDGHHFGGAVAVDGLQDALEDGVGDGAHELADLGGVEAAWPVVHRRAQRRGGDGLVHDGERVAHGAVAGFGEQSESAASSACDALGVGDGAELAEDVDELDGVKAEVLAARADGLRECPRAAWWPS